jgi:ATP-binding cassette subfamily B protein
MASRGWIAVGLASLGPAFVTGGAGVTALAVGVGGVFLGYQAIGRLASGFSYLASAFVAWKQVGMLFRSARRIGSTPAAALEELRRGEASGEGSGTESDRSPQPVLEARDLVFRYRADGEPVLRGCSLGIRAGERILVQGPSGGGKSTLSSVLMGMRTPQSGLVLVHGLDRATLGADGWRRRVVAAAQFHENHILAGSLAFNLLMGRCWPPEEGDLEEAEEVCRELGLGELLDRMPSGLRQMVGETGWQLSHGEKSRVYIARSLLQGADVVILDESFAALDPESLERALRCVLRRARALLVIAHP